MPIEYAFSLKHDLVYARHFGMVTLDDLATNFATYLADPLYVPERPEFIDLSTASHAKLTLADAMALVTAVNQQGGERPVRTLTVCWAPGDLAFGMARLYSSVAAQQDGIRVAVAREQSDALGLMGLRYRTVSELLAAGAFEGGTMALPERPLRSGSS